jgi:hypothetical protein
VMQALSEGAGRQSAIGGLMFQDAQMREGRAYEAAMAKEAERRANLEWGRRQGIQAETAATVAEELAREQESLQTKRLDAATSDANRARTHAAYLARLREAKAAQRQEDLIAAHADAAKLLADAKLLEREEDNIRAVEAARLELKGEEAQKQFDAKVDRAKEAESHLSKLYEGLKDAGVEWDDETKTYVSGSDYMDQIHRAQERVEAAWNATGVPSLMKDRNINSIRLGHFEQGVVASISLDLKRTPEIWKGVVNGLQSEKGSGDYNAAVETIKPYIEDALDASRIRVTNSERERIRDAVIERIGTYKGELDETVTDTTVTTTTGDLGSSLFGGDRLDDIALDITVEDVGSVAAIQAQIDASPVKGGRAGRTPRRHPLAGKLATAMKRDPEYLLPLLMKERDKLLQTQKHMAPSSFNVGHGKRLEKIEALIQQFQGMVGEPQASAGGDLGDGEVEDIQVTQTQPAGFLNQQGGMISRADERSYAPEDVNARWA